MSIQNEVIFIKGPSKWIRTQNRFIHHFLKTSFRNWKIWYYLQTFRMGFSPDKISIDQLDFLQIFQSFQTQRHQFSRFKSAGNPKIRRIQVPKAIWKLLKIGARIVENCVPFAKSTKVDDNLFGNVCCNVDLCANASNTHVGRIGSDWNSALTT